MMSFTFVVEDGTGVAGANSYVSVDEADDILSMNIHISNKWMALDQSEKESLLAWASQFLDARTRWFGTRVTAASGLRWPRKGVVDRDGNEISDNIIPRQLKIGTAEMARFLLDEDRSAERDQDGLVRLKADVIELEFREGYVLPKVPEHLRYLLLGLGAVSTGTGPQFKRIIR